MSFRSFHFALAADVSPPSSKKHAHRSVAQHFIDHKMFKMPCPRGSTCFYGSGG